MTAAIAVSGLVKDSGSRPRAPDHLDLHVETGEVHGFLGPNGAEKTTTICVLLGLLRRRRPCHPARRLAGGPDPDRREELLERFQLDLSNKIRAYSKGNRQKVALVAAFSSDVELYLLDEPTSRLDPLMESVFQDVVQELRAAGKSILLSSHILSEVEALCDRVTIVRTVGLLRAARSTSCVTSPHVGGGRHRQAARVGDAVGRGARRRDVRVDGGYRAR